jgi:hypothetical protein
MLGWRGRCRAEGKSQKARGRQGCLISKSIREYPWGSRVGGGAECERMAPRPEPLNTTAPQSRAWSLAPLTSRGRRGCLWPEDQRQP